MVQDSAVTIIVLIGVFLGFVFAALYAYHTSLIEVAPNASDSASGPLLVQEQHRDDDPSEVQKKVWTISNAIARGANAFLMKEYFYLAIFIVIFSIILLLLLGFVHNWPAALLTVASFILGAVTSIACGFMGMKIAVYANSRTCVQAVHGMDAAFKTAFKAGCVMGFSLVSTGLLMLFILVNLISLYYTDAMSVDDVLPDGKTFGTHTQWMFECVAGYGLGGSSIALFGRVGGGIYTKAADVGADLVGKVEQGLPEDDPKNPAVVADNVGDNVGDIAGMGADLFGSFAESSCAAMVIAAQSTDERIWTSWPAICLPLVIAGAGIIGSLLTTFVATHVMAVSSEKEIEPTLKAQILVSTLIMTPVSFVICWYFLPSEFNISTVTNCKNWHVFLCIMCGLWSGMIIGYVTEYFTSHSYTPVRELANACKTGAATNIIYGLALGYKSVIVPVLCMAVTIYVSYSLAGMYGIACAAIGILSTMCIGLTIDAYGPICDNAGGIAEMAGMPEEVREKTDALDAAGNTTAAIGKGFAIGSAALVSLALFGGFVTIKDMKTVDILQPFEFAGLLVGAMLPYWFSAMTMKSVGKAALSMVEEVRRQFREHPGILDGSEEPNYEECVGISTEASLREMLPPGALVMLTPIIVGFLFGVDALAGVLAGSLVSGVQIAISASNTGGAWDNAKKYIEAGNLGEGRGKHSEDHKAAVVGDTVGDPLKDTSGPSLNILIKLMAIISLVLAPAFPSTSSGGLLEQWFG